jgi:hypothetical protein
MGKNRGFWGTYPWAVFVFFFPILSQSHFPRLKLTFISFCFMCPFMCVGFGLRHATGTDARGRAAASGTSTPVR